MAHRRDHHADELQIREEGRGRKQTARKRHPTRMSAKPGASNAIVACARTTNVGHVALQRGISIRSCPYSGPDGRVRSRPDRQAASPNLPANPNVAVCVCLEGRQPRSSRPVAPTQGRLPRMTTGACENAQDATYITGCHSTMGPAMAPVLSTTLQCTRCAVLAASPPTPRTRACVRPNPRGQQPCRRQRASVGARG